MDFDRASFEQLTVAKKLFVNGDAYFSSWQDSTPHPGRLIFSGLRTWSITTDSGGLIVTRQEGDKQIEVARITPAGDLSVRAVKIANINIADIIDTPIPRPIPPERANAVLTTAAMIELINQTIAGENVPDSTLRVRAINAPDATTPIAINGSISASGNVNCASLASIPRIIENLAAESTFDMSCANVWYIRSCAETRVTVNLDFSKCAISSPPQQILFEFYLDSKVAQTTIAFIRGAHTGGFILNRETRQKECRLLFDARLCLARNADADAQRMPPGREYMRYDESRDSLLPSRNCATILRNFGANHYAALDDAFLAISAPSFAAGSGLIRALTLAADMKAIVDYKELPLPPLIANTANLGESFVICDNGAIISIEKESHRQIYWANTTTKIAQVAESPISWIAEGCSSARMIVGGNSATGAYFIAKKENVIFPFVFNALPTADSDSAIGGFLAAESGIFFGFGRKTLHIYSLSDAPNASGVLIRSVAIIAADINMQIRGVWSDACGKTCIISTQGNAFSEILYYECQPSDFTLRARIEIPAAEPGAFYGCSKQAIKLSLDGRSLIIAPANIKYGRRVFVYYRAGGLWILNSTIPISATLSLGMMNIVGPGDNAFAVCIADAGLQLIN
ncbi:MAG: hypothetical protein M0R33_17275 [Methylomonas sp.]|jgi:hypothetical protein|uniref:hypothetical protein n=1 Tax=Methylomonas sp. TaxID=418 RepID=UPI0025E8C6AA|nr:hypothetical protein [Methylomonas sp.]MCK9608199.1 hypothetical protein [Methylomonas sp.]